MRDQTAKSPKYREPCKVEWDKNLSLLCEAVDQYAMQCAKREMVELSVLSSWKDMVKGQIEERISKLKQNFKQPTGKVLQNAHVKACLSDLHNKYFFIPADIAPTKIIIICKMYYIKTLIIGTTRELLPRLIKGSIEPTHGSVCSDVRKLRSMDVLKLQSTKADWNTKCMSFSTMALKAHCSVLNFPVQL